MNSDFESERQAKFAKNLPDEIKVAMWNEVSICRRITNIQKFHKHFGMDTVNAANAARAIAKK